MENSAMIHPISSTKPSTTSTPTWKV